MAFLLHPEISLVIQNVYFSGLMQYGPLSGDTELGVAIMWYTNCDFVWLPMGIMADAWSYLLLFSWSTVAGVC